MRVLIYHPTDIGTFEIAQDENRKYHMLYDDSSLGCFSSVQEAVDALVSNSTSPVYKVQTEELIDTSKLGISKDYLEWQSPY